jgi:hypothetical protein
MKYLGLIRGRCWKIFFTTLAPAAAARRPSSAIDSSASDLSFWLIAR